MSSRDRPLGARIDTLSATGGNEAASFRWFVGLATVLAVTIIALYWLVPATQRALYREHGVVEWATALLFLAASVVGVRRLRGAGAGWRDPRWIIPGLSLLAMLDEVSWAISPLGIKPPTVLGKRFDGVHDILEIGVIWTRDSAPGWVAAVLGIAIAGGLVWAVVTAPRWWRFVSRPGPWRFFALAAGLGAAAQVLDVAIHGSRDARLFEETLELDGALALLFSALSLGPRGRGRS